MATLEQLEAALRAADAAGNTEDARRLAQAYAEARKQRSTMADQKEDPAPDPTAGMSGFDRFMAGVGKSIVDAGRGLKQAGTDAARYFVESNPVIFGEGGGRAGKSLRQSLAEQQQAIDRADQLDAPLMDTGAGLAGNVAGYAAQLLGGGAALRGTAAARAALPATVAGNTAQGAVLGGLQPVSSDETRVGNAALGGAFGAGGAALGKVLQALGGSLGNSVSPAAREVYEAAKARGIDLTPAQLSDSRFIRYAQSMLRSVPFTGAQGRYANQVSDFTRAVSKEIGENTDRITPEVYAAAKSRIGSEFNRLSERNALQIDTGTAGRLAAIQREAAQFGSEESQRAVRGALARLFDQAQDGVIPGRAYQSLDSQLGKLAKQGGEKGHYIGEVRSALREAMDASISPADRAAWQTARGQYGNLKTIRDLVYREGGDGNIAPAQLLRRVTANNAGKEAMASGRRGGLGELARIGQRMKEPPSSGTTERGIVSGLLGGAAYIDPVTGGATALGLNLASRGLDSQALARFLMHENPGMSAKVAAQIAMRLSNPAGQTTQSRVASDR